MTNEEVIKLGVATLLKETPENPDSEDLKGTPGRVLKAFREMTSGYGQDASEILSTVFEQPFDEMVMLRGIRFTSLCAHHLLPFSGTATVAYIPNGKVVGLSKLARLVDCYAKRLQLQEQLTMQVSKALMLYLPGCRGAGCIIEAQHSCLGCRGARQPDALMVTSSLEGCFKDDSTCRNEFLLLSK